MDRAALPPWFLEILAGLKTGKDRAELTTGSDVVGAVYIIGVGGGEHCYLVAGPDARTRHGHE